MQPIWINGWQYYYLKTVLYLDEKCTKPVERRFMTANETLQFYNQLKYGR